MPYICEKKDYLKDCGNAIDEINAGDYSKIVFSRIQALEFKRNPIDVFNDLADHYPNAFVYLLSIEGFGCWMGASPESFLEIDDASLSTTSLAGTKTSIDKPWGEKEINEQALVSSFILSKLKDSDVTELEKTSPYTYDTGAVFHLKTDIKCKIRNPKVVSLIKALHPTPATCGIPQKEALNYIKFHEPHDRSIYTGFIGPTDKNNVNLFVNLRCMEVMENVVYLYVGGGLTKDSIPELEWQETESKAKTLSRFIV